MRSYNGNDRKAYKKALAWGAYIMRKEKEIRNSLRWKMGKMNCGKISCAYN